LKIVMDVPANLLDAETPHLLLQPLVENAIRHGVARRSKPGEVVIAATRAESQLCLQVRDNGPGLNQQPPQEGLGLEATRKRLRTLYGDHQSLEIISAPERGVEVRLQIPFSTPSRLLEKSVFQGPEVSLGR